MKNVIAQILPRTLCGIVSYEIDKKGFLIKRNTNTLPSPEDVYNSAELFSEILYNALHHRMVLEQCTVHLIHHLRDIDTLCPLDFQAEITLSCGRDYRHWNISYLDDDKGDMPDNIACIVLACEKGQSTDNLDYLAAYYTSQSDTHETYFFIPLECIKQITLA